MTYEQAKTAADKLVKKLQEWEATKDRGRLANLRRGLSETTRHYAWEVLGCFGNQAIANPVYETVAGCFALRPENHSDTGNLGTTLRAIQKATKGSKLENLDSRFRRLASCQTRDEIYKHVRPVIKLAKSKGVSVDYRQLFLDLMFWNDWTRTDWAKAYWETPEAPPEFGLDELEST